MVKYTKVTVIVGIINAYNRQYNLKLAKIYVLYMIELYYKFLP